MTSRSGDALETPEAWPSPSDPAAVRVAVFASGGGSNFQALVDHQRADLWQIVLLVTDRAGAGAVERARQAGIAVAHIPTVGRGAAEVEAETLRVLTEARVDLVLLAGYLKLVPPRVVARYRQRVLNIHPALLPSFGGKGMYGMHVHRAVQASGVRVTGATVHLVDEEYDRGRILAQWPVPVCGGDTPEEIAARVLEVEHWLYPAVVDHVCARVRVGADPTPYEAEGEAFRLGAD